MTLKVWFTPMERLLSGQFLGRQVLYLFGHPDSALTTSLLEFGHVYRAWSYQQKKSEKFPEFGSDFWFLENSILSKILGSYFQKSGQLAAPKNQIWFFSDFSKKIWGFKIFRFIRKKKLDLRIFVGRIKHRDI